MGTEEIVSILAGKQFCPTNIFVPVELNYSATFSLFRLLPNLLPVLFIRNDLRSTVKETYKLLNHDDIWDQRNMAFLSIFRKKHLLKNDLSTPLLRCLTLFDLILLSVSGMIGSGVYVLTGVVAKDFSGPSITLSNLCAAIACLFGALVFAEFSARIPKAGSSYVFIYESIGEMLAFLIGWTSIVGGITSLAVSSRTWSRYFDSLLNNKVKNFTTTHIAYWPKLEPPFSHYPDILAFDITMFLLLVMLIGLKSSKWLTNSLTIINMLALLFISITGFVLGSIQNYSPYCPYGFTGVLKGSSLLFYSYIGFEMATVAIEEAKNPSKTVPGATFLSLLFVTILYSLAGASLTYLVSYKSVDIESAFAAAYGSSRWPWARYFISSAVVLSAGGNLLSGTYGVIRFMYAMSNDGLLPSKLSYVSPSRHVPVLAACLSCIIISLLATFFDIKDLIGFTDISALLAYSTVSAGLLIERYSTILPVTDSHYQLVSSNDTDVDHNIDQDVDQDVDQGVDHDVDRNIDHNIDHNVDHDVDTITVDYDKYPFFTLIIRRLLRPCVPIIDQYSPKKLAIILLLIFISNILVLAISFQLTYLHRHWHLILIVLCLLISFIILVLFCLLRQNVFTNDSTLLFVCPGVPLTPLISITIYMFLMVSLDAHDWLAYMGVVAIGLIVYFAFSYRHSKAAATLQ
ncbi:unnamed protein product [Didymodactylos carnosus]|uniref:Cationic amino acid transporter C-terminal domain-containing protein n=1 Tax=Didymodactylos carnosus TaxID=1234261 RepID=A0A814I5I9_9BILA|nr:unnamed protein product [Didymodactylos carnosus]CAF3788831.1 unnamed protein product [Didymodactylos carnosus]